jgi:regulator of protease activity HflC (stomatin/prohibitin superfamily)
MPVDIQTPSPDLVATPSHERVARAIPGAPILLLLLLVMAACIAIFATQIVQGPLLWMPGLGLAASLFLSTGFFTLQPNEARVLILFGGYKGTVRNSGFYWANPFLSRGKMVQTNSSAFKPTGAGQANTRFAKSKMSLRARTLNGVPLKVNDKRGNPIEIAAIVVWRINDTAQAMFDVDDYENFVPIQSESALRHIANMYSYDDGDGNETSLRSNVDGVSAALRAELEERCAKAGVAIDEARLSHLAYAPEIAQVMLRRQQAEAVIAARQRIVEGAVGMVEMALNELSAKAVVVLDDERRAAMVSNLMVVLCSESEVHPVVNAGTLYS